MPAANFRVGCWPPFSESDAGRHFYPSRMPAAIFIRVGKTAGAAGPAGSDEPPATFIRVDYPSHDGSGAGGGGGGDRRTELERRAEEWELFVH